MKKRLIQFASLAGMALAASMSAHAGDWVLNPRLCPDLVEDRIDQRVTTGPRDRAEDIADMRQIECPARAWTYVASRGEVRAKRAPVYTGPAVVYVSHNGYYQRPVVKRKSQKTPALVTIRIK